MRVALVHDYLVDAGGAERVVETLHELYPAAPVYTSVFAPTTTFASFRAMDVRTSFLQHFGLTKRNYKFALPLYPIAFESFDLSAYDVVISSASGFAKGVITPAETLHVCYCYTPPRFAWNFHEYIAREQLGAAQKFLIGWLVHYLRGWDLDTAQRVDEFIGVSHQVARRIQKIYRRAATVIHPPVNVDWFAPSDARENYYLIVSRLAPYKRIDLAVQAFNRLRLPLKIIGAGADEMRLRKMAESNVEFLGHLPREQLAQMYAHSRAVIFPGVEDFGIVPLEANAAGRPVIAYAAGGALETVIENVTGAFFREPTVEALIETINQTDPTRFDPRAMRDHALQFSPAHFKERIADFVTSRWNEFRK
ncbi:MAG: glycosyltransferase [Chloroflexi bacterium]|nr:glycosyltransferase [Chloroflexota bacterium]